MTFAWLMPFEVEVKTWPLNPTSANRTGLALFAVLALVSVYKVLANLDPTFLTRCMEHRWAKGDIRHYIARTAASVYGSKPPASR